MNILNVGENEMFFCSRGNDIADDFRTLRAIFLELIPFRSYAYKIAKDTSALPDYKKKSDSV
jgi:hypothetical protein